MYNHQGFNQGQQQQQQKQFNPYQNNNQGFINPNDFISKTPQQTFQTPSSGFNMGDLSLNTNGNTVKKGKEDPFKNLVNLK